MTSPLAKEASVAWSAYASTVRLGGSIPERGLAFTNALAAEEKLQLVELAEKNKPEPEAA